jgi:hexosaminidase
MSWRGAQGGIDAATAGHQVVMTPNTYVYLDYYQSEDRENEPPAIGGNLPLEQVYRFDPVEGVPADKHSFVLGGQGNIWTEYIPTGEQVDYMTYPRALAIAESVWSAPEQKDYAAFLDRLRPELARLDRLGVNYRRLD